MSQVGRVAALVFFLLTSCGWPALASSDKPLVEPRVAEAMPILAFGAILIVIVLAAGLWYAYRAQKLVEKRQEERGLALDTVEVIAVTPDQSRQRRRIATRMVAIYLIALVAVNPPVLALVNKPTLILGLPALWVWCYAWYVLTIVALVVGTLRILGIEGGL